MRRIQRLLRLSPSKIAGSYIVLGVAWILVTDQLVQSIADSQTALVQLQTAKGWLFIAGSGLLILGLTLTRERQVEDTKQRLSMSTQQLQVLHRIFRHDIRNDLNVVQGNIDMLLETVEESTRRDRLKAADRAVQQLLDMSEKLTVIDTSNPTATASTRIDLITVVTPVLEQLKAAHPEVTFKTDLPDEAWIIGEVTLGQAIQECLENAILHFDRELHQLEITTTVEQSLSTVTFTMQDNGPGVPPNDLRAIRSGGETELYHASGVGLWLVTWLCRSHGATVEVTKPETGGTTVTMEFKAAPPMNRLPVIATNTSLTHTETVTADS